MLVLAMCLTNPFYIFYPELTYEVTHCLGEVVDDFLFFLISYTIFAMFSEVCYFWGVCFAC